MYYIDGLRFTWYQLKSWVCQHRCAHAYAYLLKHDKDFRFGEYTKILLKHRNRHYVLGGDSLDEIMDPLNFIDLPKKDS